MRQALDRSTAGTRELRIFDEDDAAIIERLMSARGLLERLPVTFSTMGERVGEACSRRCPRRANPMSRYMDWTLYVSSVSFGLVRSLQPRHQPVPHDSVRTSGSERAYGIRLVA